MLYRFENTFTGGDLIVLQRVRYDVIMNIKESIKDKEIKEHTTKELLSKIYTYTNLLCSLLGNLQI